MNNNIRNHDYLLAFAFGLKVDTSDNIVRKSVNTENNEEQFNGKEASDFTPVG
jgi:hypothetical protein